MATWTLRLNDHEERCLSVIAAAYGAGPLTKAECVKTMILATVANDPNLAAFVAGLESAPIQPATVDTVNF